MFVQIGKTGFVAGRVLGVVFAEATKRGYRLWMLELVLDSSDIPRLSAMEIRLPVSWRGVVKLARKTEVRRLVAVKVLGV